MTWLSPEATCRVGSRSAACGAGVIEKTHAIDGDGAAGRNLAQTDDGRFTDATGGIATGICASNTRLGA